MPLRSSCSCLGKADESRVRILGTTSKAVHVFTRGRRRAVRIYIKLGKRVGLTIRQLGYSTKNALKDWHMECEQRLDSPAGYVHRPRHSQAHKVRAVEHDLRHGRCVPATIKALGYPSRALLACMGPGVASADAHARRWSIPGADTGNEAVGRRRLVPATSQRTGGGTRAERVSAIAVQVEESAARPRRTRIEEAPARRLGKP